MQIQKNGKRKAHTNIDLVSITFTEAKRRSKVCISQDLGLKKCAINFNIYVADYYLATQKLFKIKQAVTGKTTLQYFTAHSKRQNNGHLKPYSANPNPLPFENVAKVWGVNSDF